MPFTYPHFGSLTYVFEILLTELGRTDIMLPKEPSRKTSELGSRYSPEFVCTPFKLTLGTFIEMLELGADQLGIGGGNMYCRFGLYWPVQRLILEDLGYDFEFYPIPIFDKPLNLVKSLQAVGNNCTVWETIKAFRTTWIKTRYIELVDELHFKYRALELEPNQADRLVKKLHREIVEIKGLGNLRRLGKQIPEKFENTIEIDKEKRKNAIRIGVCGEIYVALEPVLNLDVHRKLNDLGVITTNCVSFGMLIDFGRKINPFIRLPYQKARKAAKPYIGQRCGGETQENIGDIILYKKKNWDGLVHLYPFTCMPEIITRSIAPEVSKKYDMPFLSLVIDEHTGETGYLTRLEAFVDLLRRKKEKMIG
ncbi:MAG: CoA protein activase [Candidatus Heimdallarchaeota archaeon]|nr:CoA protein activase [Candidatus Heimdallarchaeota archaeon]